MSSNDVSVIIPTFRRERQLVEAVASALAQGDVCREVLVLDDSPEGSARGAVAPFADGRVRYHPRAVPSGGRPALVRNEGMEMASGRYLHFLDDDDRLFPGALADLRAALEARSDAGMAFGTIVPFSDDGAVRADHVAHFAEAARRARRIRGRMHLVSKLLFDSACFLNSACLVRREAATEAGGFDAAIPRAEDIEFYLRVIRARGHVFVDRPVLHYRTGAPSLMHDLAPDDTRLKESYRRFYGKYRRAHGRAELLALKVLARLTR